MSEHQAPSIPLPALLLLAQGVPATQADLPSPLEMAQKLVAASVTKSALPLGRLVILSLMAGGFIALGGLSSSLVLEGGLIVTGAIWLAYLRDADPAS